MHERGSDSARRYVLLTTNEVAASGINGLALVVGAAPNGVVCLLSALDLHGIGTETPSRVRLALPRRSRKPSLEWPPVRVFRFGGASMTEGAEVHTVEGGWPPSSVVVNCQVNTISA